ncbi:MAG: sulfatase [Cyclobacteriaceae bacterium]
MKIINQPDLVSFSVTGKSQWINNAIEKGIRTAAFLCIILLLVSCGKEAPKSPYNVLLICVDDLRPELNSYGVDYIKSPNIDRLAKSGVLFQNHYVNSPSCGPSRYTLLTGLYGKPHNNAIFQRAESIAGGASVPPSMPEWFRQAGYTTVSIGKVSHHPGGWGGEDWDDQSIVEMPDAWDRQLMPVGAWQHPRGAMHGLANGEIRVNPSQMDVFQTKEGGDEIYPDGLIAEEALSQIKLLSKDESQPFFMAVGIIKPHLPFGAPKFYYDLYEGVELPAVSNPEKPSWKSTWFSSGEFRRYNNWGKDPNEDSLFALEVRRHYAACVSYADAQVGKVLAELKKSGLDKNTIVVLWGDHGWNLGEHAIWGKHNLFEEALRSPLIIAAPGVGQSTSSTLVESVDIFPTLCDLTGLSIPEFSHGESLVSVFQASTDPTQVAFSYSPKAATLRTATHRFIEHKSGDVELFDHTSPEKEGRNIAEDYPELVDQLRQQLEEKQKVRGGQ